jgi:hypothetical protein
MHQDYHPHSHSIIRLQQGCTVNEPRLYFGGTTALLSRPSILGSLTESISFENTCKWSSILTNWLHQRCRILPVIVTGTREILLCPVANSDREILTAEVWWTVALFCRIKQGLMQGLWQYLHIQLPASITNMTTTWKNMNVLVDPSS